jgi:ribosomal protein S18 acetylase RimI-like enzyme
LSCSFAPAALDFAAPPRADRHDDSIGQSSTRIRPATPPDGEGIGEVHAASWTAAYGDILDANFLARAAGGRRRRWPSLLPTLLETPGLVLVAERETQIVGFAHAGPDNQGRPIAEIYGFYTHPDVWGSGAATELMTETCSTLAEGFGEVVLWTLRDAGRARRFYEKAGFRATGIEKAEPLTDWTTRETVERPAIEYIKSLAPRTPDA